MERIKPEKDFKLNDREYKAGVVYNVDRYVYDFAEKSGALDVPGKKPPVNKAVAEAPKKKGITSKKDALQTKDGGS